MPGRMIRNGQAYRYGYQGEFAETDEETGKPAFQLRIYDPRINRWMSPDPYGQHQSPYMAMSNRPNSVVDPDGGCDDGKGNLIPCPEKGGLHHQLDGISITAKGNPNALKPVGIDQDMFAAQSWEFNNGVRQAGMDFLTNETTLAFAALVAAPFVWELAPFLQAEASLIYNHGNVIKTALTSASSGFALSAEGAGLRFTYNLATEAIANKHNLGNYNAIGVIGGTFMPGFGGEILTSKFEYTLGGNFNVVSTSDFIINLSVGQLNNSIHRNLDLVSNALGNKGAINAYNHIFKVGSSATTGMFANYFK